MNDYLVETLFDRPYYKQLAAQGKLKLVHEEISQYDLVRRGMSRPFVSKPGSEYHYSGQGLQVLGRIIEYISGQRLDKFISSNLLFPLGVKHHATMSYLSPSQLALIDGGLSSALHVFIPSPYNTSKKVCDSWYYSQPIESLYGNHWGQADACGASILSSIDLLRFITFLSNVIGEDLLHEAEASRFPLTWGVSNHGGQYQFGHNGAFGGIRAFCESTWDNIQYCLLGACDQNDDFYKIREKVVQLGRTLRNSNMEPVGWKQYGFD